MRFNAAITQEKDLFVAQCLEVDVASQGDTPEEAVKNLQEALVLYLEDAPAGDVPRIVPIDVELPTASHR